jgi:hypothetical protein
MDMKVLQTTQSMDITMNTKLPVPVMPDYEGMKLDTFTERIEMPAFRMKETHAPTVSKPI